MNTENKTGEQAEQPTGPIERFRESKKEDEAQLQRDGLEAGHTFANSAPYRQLRRLARWREKFGQDYTRWLYSDQIYFGDVAKALDEDDAHMIDREMRERHDVDMDEPEWIDGFIDGALERFDELEKQA